MKLRGFAALRAIFHAKTHSRKTFVVKFPAIHYFYRMTEENLKILSFFENIEKYYGCKTEITEGLYSLQESFDNHSTTWNLSEFTLIRSGYRKSGGRMMMEGEKMYFEISAALIVSFKQTGRNSFEFIEKYGESVFRITKIRFHYRY